MRSGVRTGVDNVQSILDALNTLTNKDVLVGIPEDKSAREDGEFSNAAIGYINENGSPEQNIPPRPHLKPGVKASEPDFINHLRLAAQKALDGNQSGAITSLNRAGSNAAEGVRRYIHNAGLDPLSPVTLKIRKTRKKSPRQGEKPLIDTGEYIRSITYIVRDKDADT
ncbi:hypothetical protein [Atlantibacter hermannii]|uniref:hypothetical protein n=1 Tax=Atlantibacter hermannii TaxID=565 RepID=UPI002898D2A5|nr:hypothetical protein [Atlantibacter hermannii]